MRSCILVLAVWLTGLLLSGCTAKADDWAGDWVWSVEEKPAMVLRLDASAHGDLSRPLHLTMDANAGYWRMIDASSELATIAVTPVETSVETITLRAIDSLRGETTNYRLTRTGPDEAELTLADIPAAPPFPLRRAATPTTVATDWIPGRAYGGPPLLADNPKLTRLFAEDQAARQGTAPIGLDVTRQDMERRVIVRRLLDAGQVRSGTDHYHAAFIFQHGDRPDDYLLAHALASLPWRGDEMMPPGSRRRRWIGIFSPLDARKSTALNSRFRTTAAVPLKARTTAHSCPTACGRLRAFRLSRPRRNSCVNMSGTIDVPRRLPGPDRTATLRQS